MRGRGLRLCALAALVATACGHAKTVERPPVEAPAAEASAAEAPAAKAPARAKLSGGGTMKSGGVTLSTSPAGLLEPGAAKEIQERLARAGVLEGRPTGELDGPTHAALARFQRAHDLPATGEPDDATVRALGLAPEAIFKKSSAAN